MRDIQNIPTEKLHSFQQHPFRVTDDDAMQALRLSIAEHGILNPLIIRPIRTVEGKDSDDYEIISGHRRCYAARLCGIGILPAMVKDMDDDEALLLLIDSNLQRETLLPSEKARAYRMKLEVMKRQGKRTDLTSGQNDPKCRTAGTRSNQELAEQVGESVKQIQRYIRLTELIPELQDMVDQKKIGFTPAVELSYLPREKQELFVQAMDYSQNTPSLSQAQRIRKLGQKDDFSLYDMCEIMEEVKNKEQKGIILPHEILKKYFPQSYTPEKMECVIMNLLERWGKNNTEYKNNTE